MFSSLLERSENKGGYGLGGCFILILDSLYYWDKSFFAIVMFYSKSSAEIVLPSGIIDFLSRSRESERRISEGIKKKIKK